MGGGSQVRRERKEIETAAIQKISREEAAIESRKRAPVARRINIVPEQVNQVDDMLIPRSNRDLFHKLLSAPERVSGTDRGGLPRLFKRLKDTLSKLKF